MRRKASHLRRWLRLSLATFLLLIVIHLALPALFLILQVPSFAIGNEAVWILRWENTSDSTGIQFNLLLLLTIAVGVGLLGILLPPNRQHTD
ncbi:hypothetical protein HJG54_32460 [Leptolyngbya sp. NK1-12]|uniref:Uncharacterized protein n=1 Tax=Leptolyngbya sp. NK1-12 TaxID=2547451 RepID=A0AA96WKI5_9CYAN|nr:hypothetical protein [Leptolyngbya sp. NK1-12]MBF2050162.1 hypothetical protein [Elainella sp. C42_A2020_010]WNZ27577.1 hypothetical protein HJG54_32460 [Leptolyngbya sp. NK1-12]